MYRISRRPCRILCLFRDLLLFSRIVAYLEYGTAGSGSKREIPQNLRVVQGKIYQGPIHDRQFKVVAAEEQARETWAVPERFWQVSTYGRAHHVRVTRNRRPASSIFSIDDPCVHSFPLSLSPSLPLSFFSFSIDHSIKLLPGLDRFRCTVLGLGHNPVGLLSSHNRC